MDLKNKRIVFLGDSITYGYGLNSIYDIYYNQLKLITDVAKVEGYGLNGSSIAKTTLSGCDYFSDEASFISRAKAMDNDADIVVVFGGTNDFGNISSLLGIPSSTDDYTFMGALNNLIIYLKEKYSNKRIVLLTPLHRYDDKSPNLNNLFLNDYVEAIRYASISHHVDLIDLYNNLKISPNNNNYFLDGIHPTRRGHKLLAEFLANELNKL